jgi:hypothetical protein
MSVLPDTLLADGPALEEGCVCVCVCVYVCVYLYVFFCVFVSVYVSIRSLCKD